MAAPPLANSQTLCPPTESLLEIPNDLIRELQSEARPRASNAGDGWLIDQLQAVIPVLPDGGPDWDRRPTAAKLRLTRDCIELRWPAAGGIGSLRDEASLILTFGLDQAAPACAAVRVIDVPKLDQNEWNVRATPGGLGQALLDSMLLAPRFDRERLQYRSVIADDILRRWADIGVLRAKVFDRVLVCPKCQSLPVYRRWCQHCHSPRVVREQQVYHRDCDYVGAVDEFTREAGFACPKCQTRDLISETDFEYVDVGFRCEACQWRSGQLGEVAECLQCHDRFLPDQACELLLTTYHANRLDLFTPI